MLTTQLYPKALDQIDLEAKPRILASVQHIPINKFSISQLTYKVYKIMARYELNDTILLCIFCQKLLQKLKQLDEDHIYVLFV
jgi:hypothetical protein